LIEKTIIYFLPMAEDVALRSINILNKEKNMTPFKIKSKILIPLVLTIIFLMAVFIYGVFWMQDRNIKDRANNTFDSIESLFDNTLNINACLMGALLETLMRDRSLNEALQKKDGSLLLKLVAPLFENLQLQHEITHLYFSDPTRVNLLRAHKATPCTAML
jgi:hypothetical protein